MIRRLGLVLVASGLLAVALQVSASLSPTFGLVDEVRVELALVGEIPSGESHTLFFKDPAADAGQTRFAICGGFVPACVGKTYVLHFTQLPAGSAFSYRFERIAADGAVTTYFRGSGVVGEVSVIQAQFRYSTLPNTALLAGAPSTVVPVAIGILITFQIGRVMLRRRAPG